MSQSLKKNETNGEFRGAKKKTHSVAATQAKHNKDLDEANTYGQTKSSACERFERGISMSWQQCGKEG